MCVVYISVFVHGLIQCLLECGCNLVGAVRAVMAIENK